MSSKLIQETEDFLLVRKYIHNTSDSYDDWEVDSTGNEKYSREFHANWNYVLYEVEFVLQVSKKTGKYRIVSVTDGNQKLLAG